ncbi:hypothetical protein HY418_02895 [Candidatus Kaiserbacteria bacterium]|nr:hypothetical protein [Candidatus Kaiserbacteria bacterium]
MTIPARDIDWRWQKPALTSEGQEAFWSRQALGYDKADMTNDNAGELALVRDSCADYARRGHEAEDVVTLGGATGVRDPIVVTDALAFYGRPVQGVIFNDLAQAMVDVAVAKLTRGYQDNGVEFAAMAGPIHEVASSISHAPRRAIIGVYRAGALLESSPAQGYKLSGLDEYLNNGAIVGEHFIVDAVRVGETEHESIGMRCALSVDASKEDVAVAVAALRASIAKGANALQIVGWHDDQPGYFLSHWYSEKGIMKLIRTAFGEERAHKTVVHQCAKGYVISIDPVGTPKGIVTVLNNVVGNILPAQQVESLRVIHKLSA